jgi:hypothetical protein
LGRAGFGFSSVIEVLKKGDFVSVCCCFFVRLSWMQQDALVAEKVENFVAGKFVCRRP